MKTYTILVFFIFVLNLYLKIICIALKYLILVTESYEGFQQILEDRSIAEQIIIIERMIKVNHPSLGNDNRSNLQRMYPYLLQYLNDNSCSTVSSIFVYYIICV